MTPAARNWSLLVFMAFVAVVLTLRLEGTPTAAAQVFTPPPFPGITLTPTPDVRVVNEITNPGNGDAISGFTAIMGTALIDDFIQYEVHVSPAGLEDWRWLKTSGNVVRNGILAVLNTYDLGDGFFDVRVRAMQRDGNYAEAFLRNLEVRNTVPPTATPFVDGAGFVQPASPLLFVSPLSLPTITPTPRFRSYIPNGQGIFEPRNGDVLRGATTIIGTANGKTVYNPFNRYELYVSPSGLNNWGVIHTSAEQLWQSPLYTWDTTQVADGLYDLRLRIVYRDSNYDEYYVTRLRVANQMPTFGDGAVAERSAPGLYLPLDGTQVVGVIDLVGTTSMSNLLRWEISYSPAGAEAWQFLFSDAKTVTDDVLARLDLSELPPGVYDFRLRLVGTDYSYTDYYIRNIQSIPPTPTPIPSVPA